MNEPSFDTVDMEERTASVREAVLSGRLKDRGLCNVLLCSDREEHHVEAMELVRKNMDELWGELWLFKMYFNGIGTERDVKTALHVLHSGKALVRSGGPEQYRAINPKLFVNGEIVVCGNLNQARSPFCIWPSTVSVRTATYAWTTSFPRYTVRPVQMMGRRGVTSGSAPTRTSRSGLERCSSTVLTSKGAGLRAIF